MAEPFRTATPPDQNDEPQVDVELKEPVDDKPVTGKGAVDTKESSLLATYEEDQGRPFVAEYFEASGVWDKEPTLKRDLREIEGYVRSQVESGKLDNSTKAGIHFIKELERKAGLTRYESTATRISKLLAYIDFRKVVDGSTN